MKKRRDSVETAATVDPQAGNEKIETDGTVGTTFDATKSAVDKELAALAEDLRKTILRAGDVLRQDGDAEQLAGKLASEQALMRVLGAKINRRILAGHTACIETLESDSRTLSDRRKEVDRERAEARERGIAELTKMLTTSEGQPATAEETDAMLLHAGLFTSPVEVALTVRVDALVRRDKVLMRELSRRRATGPEPKSIALPDVARCRAWLEGATVEQIVRYSDDLVNAALVRPDLF
jgi:hypothetical protein